MRTTREQRRAALDVARSVAVPQKWALRGLGFEWREGYAHGLAGSSRECPVSSDVLGGQPREAWKAGRDAGRERRHREQAR